MRRPPGPETTAVDRLPAEVQIGQETAPPSVAAANTRRGPTPPLLRATSAAFFSLAEQPMVHGLLIIIIN